MRERLPIAPAGWPYLSLLAVLSLASYHLSPYVAVVPFSLFLFVAYFFRNPPRRIPVDKNLILSPADGVVMSVDEVWEERFLKGPAIRISIFLSLFNVHVNRSPISGTVRYLYYRPGAFLPAFKSHASELNEKNFVGIEGCSTKVLVTQVTGFIARRIVCYLKEGDRVKAGQLFGMIKFGSCTEIFLPHGVEVLVKPGDRVRGGETVVGRIVNTR